MSILKRIFTFNRLIRSLQIFAGITITYLVIGLALVFWPSSERFQGTTATEEESETHELSEGDDHSTEAGSEEITISTRDGEVLFARRYGSYAATSIIFMHGIAGNSLTMNNGAGLLREATGAEVITPDFRGHGRSGGRRFDVNYVGQYEDDLEDIVSFIKRERPGQRVIVAGHSMGGGVAMRYALKQNAPVPDAYLLFAPNFGEGPTQRSGDDTDQDTAEEASSFVHFDVRRMIGIIMLNSVAIHALDSLPILYFNSAEQVIEYSYRAVMSAQPIRPRTSEIALQAVNSPLLVIVGSDDEVFEVGNFESFVSENSDGETIILPGLTHDGVFNDPASYAVVTDWYNRLP